MCPDGINSMITIMNIVTNEVCVLSINAQSRAVNEQCESIDAALNGGGESTTNSDNDLEDMGERIGNLE